jgi:hypothetical protein
MMQISTHAEGVVHVGGRHNAQVVHACIAQQLRQQVDRQEVHCVHQPDPDENGDGQRGDHFGLGVECGIDGVVDEFHDPFNEVLQLARHASGGTLGSHVENAQEHEAQDQGDPEGVQVEGTCAVVGKVVLDVLGGIRRGRVAAMFSSHRSEFLNG